MNKLFDIYVRDMKDWMETIKNIVVDLYDSANRLKEHIKEIETEESTKKYMDKVIVYAAHIFNEFTNKLQDLEDITVEARRSTDYLREQLDKMIVENAGLKVKLKESENTNNDTLNEIMARIDEFDTSCKALRGEIARVLNLVETNVGALSVSFKLKTEDKVPAKGPEHPRYRHEVDDNELKEEYIANGYRITKEMVDKYKGIMTYYGLMERLKRLGVWRGRNK